MTATVPIRVGIVGCGIGARHAEALQQLPEHFSVRAVCDPDAARANRVCSTLPGAKVVSDFSTLLRSREIDVVSLCTPPTLHVRQTIQALRAGVHVLCEKPMGGCLRDVDRVRAAREEAGCVVMPVFQCRYGNGIRKLKRLVDAGVAGRCYLSTIETAWRRNHTYFGNRWRGTWRGALGGAVLSQAIHAHDLLCYIVGEVARVSAVTATRVNPVEVEDCAVAAVEMADGSLASLAVTLGSAREISRLRLCFENLVAESHDKPYTTGQDPWRFTGRSPEVESQIARVLQKADFDPEGYVGQMLDLHRVITRGESSTVTLNDAYRSIELATAIYQAAKTGQAVALPIRKTDPLYDGWQNSDHRSPG